MTEHMQQSFDDWRAAQPDRAPSLRQELAYKDGFADAVMLMHAGWPMACTGAVRKAANAITEANQAEHA